MRKRRAVWLWSLAIVVSLAAVAWLRPSREPVYQGKRLSEWLDDVAKNDTNAAFAVREIGTNALPWLLEELEAKDSWLKRRMIAVAPKQEWVILKTAVIRRNRALTGFRLLGPQAEMALPTLVARVCRPDSAGSAVTALVNMVVGFPTNAWLDPVYTSRRGMENIGALRREVLTAGLIAFTNREQAVRIGGAFILQNCSFDPASAVPVLISGLKDTNEWVRLFSASGLGTMTSQPVAAIPPLIMALNDSSSMVRFYAAQSLGRYFRQAKTAVPALLKARSDPSGNVREAARSALEKIDPESAAAIPDLPDFKPLAPASRETPSP